MTHTTQTTQSEAVIKLLAMVDTLESVRVTEHYKMYFTKHGKLNKEDKDKLWELNQLKEQVSKVIKLYQNK